MQIYPIQHTMIGFSCHSLWSVSVWEDGGNIRNSSCFCIYRTTMTKVRCGSYNSCWYWCWCCLSLPLTVDDRRIFSAGWIDLWKLSSTNTGNILATIGSITDVLWCTDEEFINKLCRRRLNLNCVGNLKRGRSIRLVSYWAYCCSRGLKLKVQLLLCVFETHSWMALLLNWIGKYLQKKLVGDEWSGGMNEIISLKDSQRVVNMTDMERLVVK